MTDAELIAYIRQNVEKPFPPASPEQVAATEASLGFALPPLLRAMYLEIGNGGFGPQGSELLGVQGGMKHCNDTLDTIYKVERTHRKWKYLFEGQVYSAWPERLLLTFVWPLSRFSCVYCVPPDFPVYVYVCNFVEYCVETDESVPLIKHRNSLREWLVDRANGVNLWEEMNSLTHAMWDVLHEKSSVYPIV